MTTNGNGKWQLAFWVVTVFFFVGMGMMTKYVVANDEKREKGDEHIVEKIYTEDDKIRKEFKEEIVLLRTEQKIMRKETNDGFTKVLIEIEKLKK